MSRRKTIVPQGMQTIDVAGYPLVIGTFDGATFVTGRSVGNAINTAIQRSGMDCYLDVYQWPFDFGPSAVIGREVIHRIGCFVDELRRVVQARPMMTPQQVWAADFAEMMLAQLEVRS